MTQKTLPSQIAISSNGKIVGRVTAGAGGGEEITVGSTLLLSGGTLSANTGTTGATIPLLSGTNTWNALQTIGAAGTPLIINSTDSTSTKILFEEAGTTRGWLGCSSSYNLISWNGGSGQTTLLHGPTETVFGSSDQTASAASTSLRGTIGTGTNIAGGTLTISSGYGSGSATVSQLIFQTPTVGVSGATPQVNSARVTIDSSAAALTVPLALTTESTLGNPYATPVTGVKIYSVVRANRRMIGWVTPTGRSERVSPWLGSNNRVECAAQWNNTAQSTTNAAMTIVTAATAVAYATTNYLTTQRRNQQTISTAGGMVEQWGPLMCSRNPGNSAGGFHMAWRFGITALNTDAKLFCGLTSTAAAMTNVNPSTLFNIIGLGKDSTDTTTLAFFTNGSSGTAHKFVLTNTGTMTGILNTWWQVEIFCKSGDTQFGYRIERTSSAGVTTVDEGVTSGTQGAAGGIPADTTAFAPHLWGCSTSAVATTIQFSQFFLETD